MLNSSFNRAEMFLKSASERKGKQDLVSSSNALLKPIQRLAIVQDSDVCPKDICAFKKERKGRPWVMCTKCLQWYRCKCVGMTKRQSESVPVWLCRHCK